MYTFFFLLIKVMLIVNHFWKIWKTINRGDMIHILGIFPVKNLGVLLCIITQFSRGVSDSHYFQEKSPRTTAIGS